MRRICLGLPLIASLSLAAPPAAGECTRTRALDPPPMASSIGLFADPRLPAAVVRRAISAWSVCPAYGRDFPGLTVGRSGTRDLFVKFDPSAVGVDDACGRFSGREITLYARTRTRAGNIVGCGPLSQNLMHEIGHALGLADAPRSCDSFAMAKLNPRNRFHRRVQPSECRLLARRWIVAGPALPAESRLMATPFGASGPGYP